MADFLTHLAAHALGVRPDIRPDITPVFGSPVANDTHQGPSPLNHEALTEAAIPQVLHSVERRPLEEARPAMDRGAPVVPAQQHREHAREPILGGEDIAPLPKFKQPKAQSLDAHAEAQSLRGKREPSPQRVQPSTHVAPMAITPQTRVAANTAVSRAEAVTRTHIPAPAVHVTIGRVEVRAITPQPAPIQRLPEKNTHSNQSLVEYLRERNRGRR